MRRIRAAGDEDVTETRVQGDLRESQRRVEEELKRQDLRSKLLAEAEYSARRNAAVAMRWADLFATEVPGELDEQIQAQRANCERITQSKERLIGDIKQELKSKDDEYVKALKRQAEDADTLIGSMSEQFKELKEGYSAELVEIERAF